MKKLWSVCMAVVFILAGLIAVGQSQMNRPRTPVLVELFTSEGCSSCPPADAILAKLERDQPIAGSEIIVLSEHVDYWDGLGWHDRFSSHALTERQNAYGQRFGLESVYTPQMVVDGVSQFIGNDAGKAQRAAAQAGQTGKIELKISGVTVDGRKVSGAITGGAAGQLKGDLYAALVDPTAVTQVKAGENGGRQLNHVGVVRSLQRIGSVQELASGPVRFVLAAPADAIPGKERIVVFAQKTGTGTILGTALAQVAGHEQTIGIAAVR
ncbi:MAG: hypothetical protein JWM43_2623 [Acidobacteriaceae bacterium]|nr:hypothetical protein [Acidobacteriaceae bacterium]